MGLPAIARRVESSTQTATRPETARAYPRASVSLDIGLTSEHNFWSGLTMNISEGGVFVATHQSVPVGTLLSLSLTIPDGYPAIVALGEVCWTRPYGGDDDVPPGIGVRFVDVADADLSRVRRFVQSVRDPLYFEE